MMTKTENKNNNLFKWATKELSQDAILAWLLNDDEIGYDLIKDMCPSLKNVDFDIENITTQKYSIDVLVELCVLGTGEKIAVIIEDKTDTYIHDHQMLRYIEKISNEKEKYKKIIYVLFKTGCIYKWEREHYSSWISRINSINNPEREFDEGKLDDKLKNGLIISGIHQDKKIGINKDIEVQIEKIYTLKDFKYFLKSIQNQEKVLEHFCEFIANEKNKNCEDDDNNYDCAKRVLAGSNVQLRMIRPGGAGKREYEFCFCSEEFCSLEVEDTSKIEKISDNFLILPFIRKKKDETYLYAINYNLIGNKDKLHGYIPYSQLKLSSKQKFEEFKKKVNSYASELGSDHMDFQISNDTKENRLLVLSFEGEVVNEENIKKLLNLAFEIVNRIRKG